MMQMQKGFNLIELMVTVVIVGILAAIAIPSYSSYLVRSARAAAQTELLELAALQEKIYLNSNAYSPNIAAAYTGQSDGGLGKASGRTQDGRYNLAFNGVPGQTFEIRAVPVAGGPQAGDGCLLIMENGTRQWHQNNDACNSGAPVSW